MYQQLNPSSKLQGLNIVEITHLTKKWAIPSAIYNPVSSKPTEAYKYSPHLNKRGGYGFIYFLLLIKAWELWILSEELPD